MKNPTFVQHILLMQLLVTVTLGQEYCKLSKSGAETDFLLVSEAAQVGSDVGTLDVVGDNSQVNLSQHDNIYFDFDPISRYILLKTELDADVEIPANNLNMLINCVETVSPTVTVTLTLIVLLNDINDNGPIFNKIHHNTTLDEAAKTGDVVYDQAIATDDDTPRGQNYQVFYSVLNGTNSEYFEFAAQTEPIITLTKPIDYESVQEVILRIQARDNPSIGEAFSATATLTITITDADDLPPVFNQTVYRGDVQRDSGFGTVVRVVPAIYAHDQDTFNENVKYTFLTKSPFDIGETSAIVTVKDPPLSGSDPTIPVLIQAEQVNAPDKRGVALLLVHLHDANINAPKFPVEEYRVEVLENLPVGATILTVTAKDPDAGTTISYSVSDINNKVNINDRGDITLATPLDYEDEQLLSVTVSASDGNHVTRVPLIVEILNVNDNDPLPDKTFIYKDAERVPGDIIGQISATDVDNDGITFQIEGPYQDLFSINADGEIFITASEEELTESDYYFNIRVQDSGDHPRSSFVAVKVHLGPLIVPTTTTTSPNIGGAQGQVAMAGDATLVIALGAAAGVLLVVVIFLVVYIIWKNSRVREQLDKAHAPRGLPAKGLTYRQAAVPDDIPKIDLHYDGDLDESSEFDHGSTTMQHNPFHNDNINEAYLQSSGSELDREVSEIEVETAVIPYSDGYTNVRNTRFNNGHMTTFQVEDTTSSGSESSNHSDSTGDGSRRGLVNAKKSSATKNLPSWDSTDNVPEREYESMLDPDKSVTPKKDKPEITVYF